MTANQSLRRRFFNSLTRGTGEAYLLYKQYPEIDFSDLIIKGSVQNYAFDDQCEGSRASYMWRFIKGNKQRDRIVTAVLQQLTEDEENGGNLEQMCDLAVQFHQAGFKSARKVLNEKFEKNVLNELGYAGTRQVMEVGGLEVVMRVARVIGKKLYIDKSDSESSYNLDEFAKNHKELDVYHELEKAAATSKYVKTYFDSVRANKWSLPTVQNIPRFSYQIIKQRIDNRQMRFMSKSRADELSTEEVINLAKDFLRETDMAKKELYLRFFSKRKFPLSYKPILEIARGRNPSKTRMVEFAVGSLKYFSGKDIRLLALEKIRKTRNPSEYLELLVGTYKKGDHKLLLEVAHRSSNQNFIHSLVSGFLEVYRANPTTDCKEPLEAFYNRMNCGIHRCDIVRLLKENNVLSEAIFKELQYDSEENLRKFYRKHK